MITSPETIPPIIRASLWAHTCDAYHRRRPGRGQIKMASGLAGKLLRNYKDTGGADGGRSGTADPEWRAALRAPISCVACAVAMGASGRFRIIAVIIVGLSRSCELFL